MLINISNNTTTIFSPFFLNFFRFPYYSLFSFSFRQFVFFSFNSLSCLFEFFYNETYDKESIQCVDIIRAIEFYLSTLLAIKRIAFNSGIDSTSPRVVGNREIRSRISMEGPATLL